jgi:hypothetical protein
MTKLFCNLALFWFYLHKYGLRSLILKKCITSSAPIALVPSYHRPTLMLLAPRSHMWQRCGAYVAEVGAKIGGTDLVVVDLGAYPRMPI